MFNPSQFNLTFRPESYFAPGQDVVSRAYKLLTPEVLQRELDSANNAGLAPVQARLRILFAVRNELGRAYPGLVAGQYLPDYEEGQVEIARIVLHNNELDVISIRAKKQKSSIEYAVVDEYETNYTFTQPQDQSPLTFLELTTLIDTIRIEGEPDKGVTNPFRDYDIQGLMTTDEGCEFVQVLSLYYPQLEQWYYDEAVDYLENMKQAGRKR